MSGFVLVMDNLIFTKFDIHFSNNFGFSSTANLIYNISQSISVLLIIITVIFKMRPYKIFYAVPIYIEILQLQWVFFSDAHSDENYYNIYVLGLTVISIILITLLNYKIKDEIEKDNKINLLEKLLDLQIKKNKEGK